MPASDINIVRYGDAPPWPNVNRDTLDHRKDEDLVVVILEGGMSSGQPSIAMKIDMGDHDLIFETSLALWSAVTIAARGAFPEAFEGGPLETR